MFDFNDVDATSKTEQIRAWSVEMAIDSVAGSAFANSETIVIRAAMIEDFVINGNKDVT